MSRPPIELKGSNFTLPVIHLNQHQPGVIYQALIEKIRQAPSFLQNAAVVLNVARLSEDADWGTLHNTIKSTGLRIVGISGCTSAQQKENVTQAGFPLLIEGKLSPLVSSPPTAPTPPVKSKIISTPIRSGQQIYAKDADLIITSAVSAGAEIMADGNIHVYGVMRGRALAGAKGDTSSQIFCTHLNAELVSIAGEYWLSDQIPQKFHKQPSRLFLWENSLQIEPLS